MEKHKTAVNLSAFFYSLNMLKTLLGMRLITDEEFGTIANISAEHYGVEIYCV